MDSANEVLLRMPDEMTINLTSRNALAINDDPDWLRARLLLGALFRKHGPFLVEMTKKSIIVGV